MPGTTQTGALTVAELIVAYNKYAERYYLKKGKRTSTICEVKQSLKPLRRLYASLAINEFAPLYLKAVRQTMLDEKVEDDSNNPS